MKLKPFVIEFIKKFQTSVLEYIDSMHLEFTFYTNYSFILISIGLFYIIFLSPVIYNIL
jgi:hypothetical protein